MSKTETFKEFYSFALQLVALLALNLVALIYNSEYIIMAIAVDGIILGISSDAVLSKVKENSNEKKSVN